MDALELRDINPPRHRADDPELTRVRSRIGLAILQFCRSRVGSTFHAGELRRHVAETCGEVAPASADRILRSLRSDGLVSYRVTNRADSLYLIEAVTCD